MIQFIEMILMFVWGAVYAAWVCHPMKAWDEGYETARKMFSDWSKGFSDGYDYGQKLFKDYDQGFGDGFECGFNAALDSKNAEVKTEGMN